MRGFILLFFLCLFLFGIAVMRIEINRSGRTIGQLQNEVERKQQKQ